MPKSYTIHTGDCREVLRDYPDNHFDSIVTDPPYGLSFMGKGWDKGVPNEEFWLEALRVAKPGAHLLAFGGTRTFHRLTVAIEDAGWEIRDCVMWVYGSGFPKSHDVGKAIDREAGAEREVVGTKPAGNGPLKSGHVNSSGGGMSIGTERSPAIQVTAPATDAAKQWQGWGTALKPAWEPIIVARKPLVGTVAANVLRYGTGAINIDGCRVPTSENEPDSGAMYYRNRGLPMPENRQNYFGGSDSVVKSTPIDGGRWPANLMHDGSDEVVAGFPSEVKGGVWNATAGARHFNNNGKPTDYKTSAKDDSTGSAARFFYCAKTSKADREEGNTHPTVKPTDLMRYICRLVTQPNGLVLDPFCGSGSTGKAALSEGFRFVGIDLDATHTTIANARCEHAAKKSNTENSTRSEAEVSVQLSLLDGL